MAIDLLRLIAFTAAAGFAIWDVWTTPLPELAARLTLMKPFLWDGLLALVLIQLMVGEWRVRRYGTWEQLLLRCYRHAKELREWRRRHPQERWYRSQPDAEIQRAVEQVIEASKNRSGEQRP